MAETVGSRLRTALAAKGWTQSDLVRETGIDKNTVSAIANDKSQARRATLDKIEVALALTPGTLGALGEETAAGPFQLNVSRLDSGDALTQLSDADLIGELAYRVEGYRRKLAVTQQELSAAERRIAELEPLAEGGTVTPLRPVSEGHAEAGQMAARDVHTSKDRIDDEEPS